jgi:hypothetical protein
MVYLSYLKYAVYGLARFEARSELRLCSKRERGFAENSQVQQDLRNCHMRSQPALQQEDVGKRCECR